MTWVNLSGSLETGWRRPPIMAEMWIEAIGLLAGGLGIVAWIPQIRDVWVHEQHEGISLTTFTVVTVALSLWLLYGVLVDSLAMIVAMAQPQPRTGLISSLMALKGLCPVDRATWEMAQSMMTPSTMATGWSHNKV